MHIFFICIFEELRYMIICCTMLLLKMWEDQIFRVFMIKRGIFLQRSHHRPDSRYQGKTAGLRPSSIPFKTEKCKRWEISQLPDVSWNDARIPHYLFITVVKETYRKMCNTEKKSYFISLVFCQEGIKVYQRKDLETKAKIFHLKHPSKKSKNFKTHKSHHFSN